MAKYRIRNIIKGILVIALLPGCETGLQDNLISKIDQQCGTAVKPGCTIVLKDITRFKWDKMYLFGSWTASDSIEKVIGLKYDGDDVEDKDMRMLFTYGSKVVYEEDFKPLDHYNSTINFPDTGDSLRQAMLPYITPSKATFKVEKDKTEGNCKDCFDYRLIPVRPPLNGVALISTIKNKQ